MQSVKQIEIGKLWNQLIENGYSLKKCKDYEIIECNGIQIQTYGNEYVDLVFLSRHKTEKHLLKIVVSVGKDQRDVTVTTDHVCLVYDKDHFLQNLSAKELKVGQYVSMFDDTTEFIQNDKKGFERFATISQIEDLGTTQEFVYDCEVNDKSHSFYANDILVHNSQFIDIQCVSKYIREKYNLDKKIGDWPKKYKQELWNTVSNFVEEEVNPFVRGLIHDYCHTNEQNVLTYELEYMADQGLYESKKHYYIHKIFEEGDFVDKIKVTGIELKKAQVPKEMKKFLNDIYAGVVLNDWKQVDYDKYVNDLYNEFTKFSIDEIAFWKGYSTARQSTGFLQMEVGTTGIAKCCTYFNQIIHKLGLGKKYEEIRVGDKVRQLYVEKSNPYGIDAIAYKPDQWPKEFDNIFKPDYHKMFEKLILDPLKRYREACKFHDTDPSKQVEFDIFSL